MLRGGVVGGAWKTLGRRLPVLAGEGEGAAFAPVGQRGVAWEVGVVGGAGTTLGRRLPVLAGERGPEYTAVGPGGVAREV
mmetsp:Transcript_20964/g.48448  ORF Transcript_20964/g.48448 Transcript_20964/m.48448 type:complete len:80 (+) Transcript_20964:1183-1422(+)